MKSREYIRAVNLIIDVTNPSDTVEVESEANVTFTSGPEGSKPAVSKVGGEAEIGGWGAIGDPVNNCISVVLLTLSDQMSKNSMINRHVCM